VKSIIASILVVLGGLFGVHAMPAATTALHSSSASSSVAARTPTGGLANADTTLNMPLLAGARITKAVSLPPTTSSPSPAPSKPFQAPKPGLVLGTSTVAAGDLVTQDQLQTALNALRSELFAVSSTPSFSGPPATTAVNTQTLALTNKIDQLSGVTISNSTIDAASLPNLSGTYLSIAAGTSTARTSLGLGYASGTDAADAYYTVGAWGDSITAATAFTADLSADLGGRTVYNEGVGGNTSTQIAARLVPATASHNWTTIIWAGFNDYTNPSQVEANIASMVASLGSNQHYLVLAVLTGSNELSGSDGYNDVVAINGVLATTYPSHFFDIREYLVQHGLSDAGITPMTQDLTDIANDTVPSSLRVDQIHPTGAADALIATQVANFITGSLDTLANPNQVLTPANLPAVFANPLSFKGFLNVDTTGSMAGYDIDRLTVLLASSTTYSTAVGMFAGVCPSSDHLAQFGAWISGVSGSSVG
jgi:lysophospholipase L1-like esterase